MGGETRRRLATLRARESVLLRFGNASLSRWGEGGEEGSCAVTMIVGALALVLAWGSCGGAGTGTTRVATTVEEPEEKSRVEKKAWSAEGAKDEPIVVVVVGGRLQSVGGGDELICCCTRLRSYSPRALACSGLLGGPSRCNAPLPPYALS